MYRFLFLIPLFFLSFSLFADVEIEELDVIIYSAPPYIVETDGEFNGITIRAIEAAFQEVGLKARFQFYPYSRSIAVCFSDPNCVWVGSFEGVGERLSGSPVSNELYQVNFIKYSTTFFYNHKVHPELATFQFKEGFKGKKIGVLRSEFDNLKNFENQGAEIITLSSHKALFHMLQSNRVDFAHYEYLVGQIEVLESGDNTIRRVQETLISSQGGLIFKNQELAEKLHKAFVKLHSDGRLLKIIQQELGSNTSINLSETVPEKITMSIKATNKK